MDKLDHQDHKDLREPLALPAMQSRDLQVKEDQLDQPEHQVNLDHEEISEVPEALDHPDQLEPEEILDRQGLQEPRVTMVQQDLLVQTVRQVRRDHEDNQDHLVPRVYLGPKELMEQEEKTGLQVLQVSEDLQVK